MKNGKLIAILLFGFAFRLIALDQSLWLDEAIVAKVISTHSYLEILRYFSPHDFHPPLYYFIMKALTGVFGLSEIALRIPSVLFALGSVAVLYFGFGMWPALFLAVNPLFIYYSQEARMYAMATLFITLVLYLLKENPTLPSPIRGCKIKEGRKSSLPYQGRIKVGFLLGLFLSLAFMTFYGTIFFSLAVLMYLFFKKQYRIVLTTIYCLLATIILLSPLLYGQLLNAKLSLASVVNWNLVLGNVTLKNFILIFIKFMSGRISFEPKIVYFGLAGLWSLFTWLFVVKGGLKDRKLSFLFLCCLLAVVCWSFVSPMLQYFRLLFLLPLVMVLLDRGANNAVIKIIIVITFIAWSLAYLLNSTQHREDWKSLAQKLDSKFPVVMITDARDPLDYYSRRFTIYDLRRIREMPKKFKEIQVINYNMEIYGIDYRKKLQEKGYRMVKEYTVRGIAYEIYSK
ncbi:MAG: glycosyltransferase family 39 protein [Patescibacteria group bacterium]